MTSHSFLKSIELDGKIQVCSAEMALKRPEYIGSNSAATHVAQVKKAMARMTLTESLGQGMPLQGLLAGLELLALVHMVISSELPVLELHEKQVEFPGINGSGGMRCRVDRIISQHNG
jgi:hypothetical protein